LEAFDIIRYRTAEIISEEDLRAKLKRSAREGRPLRVKLGLDPTAPHIHLGFAVVLKKLREFQDLGHEVHLIIGDFTARIGDPTGKSESRRMLTPEEIVENARTYKEQLSVILDGDRTVVSYNGSWLAPLRFEEIISLSSRFTVARILERDDFEKRLKGGRPIGLHEVLYPLMQAYDSVAIKADVELGGTDQVFNILAGRELQREFGQEPQVALLMPILVGLDGVNKMSKSLGNYVGITDPPAEMYGKLMSIPDQVIMDYLLLATSLAPDEVSGIGDRLKDGTLHPMEAKKRMAFEVVRLYHSQELARWAGEQFEKVVQNKGLPERIPRVNLSPSDLSGGRIWVVNLLVLAHLAESKRDARRLIAQGGVYLDGEKVSTPDLDLEVRDGMVFKVGSKNFAQIFMEGSTSSSMASVAE
jgi:tyrosyl-tRNA synthetase